MNSDRHQIFDIDDDACFLEKALYLFRCQYANNLIYKKFIDYMGVDVSRVDSLESIPFMPIEFFKWHKVITGERAVETTFVSSGTTTHNAFSRHFVTDISLYEESLLRGFNLFYGKPVDYIFISLLPSYSERNNSSLIYMMQTLMKSSGSPLSKIVKSIQELLELISKSREKGRKILLMGVSFALLDIVENYDCDLSDIIVMETGGMKGRRKEIVREELHAILCNGLNVKSIHSEYGMTELLSQAYSKGEGVYRCPPWMKVMVRDIHDPFSANRRPNRSGGLNVIDLANMNSCSFIATNDLGKLHTDGSFEVLGRFDNSDLRGCNLMVE